MIQVRFRHILGLTDDNTVRAWLRSPALPWLFWLAAAAILAVGTVERNANLLLASTLMFFFASAARMARSMRRYYIAAAVLLAFLVFLLARSITALIFGYPEGAAATLGTAFLRSDVKVHIFLSLALALAGLYLSLPLFRFAGVGSRRAQPDATSRWLLAARRSSLTVFYLTLPVQLLLDVEVALFVARNGYLAYYTGFHTAYPEALRIFGGALQIAFLCFIATNPPKRKLLIPTAAYMIEATVTLASGGRTDFVLSACIVALYVIYRHYLHGSAEAWVSRRVKWFALVAASAIIAIIGAVARWRAPSSERATGPIAPLLDVFYAQGVSINVIGYGFVYRAKVPHSMLYTFGPLADLMERHLPALVGMGPGVFTGQTVARATNSGYFSQLISYLVLGDRYLKGAGLGSSFVAELWADYSYPGIVLGSFVIGIVILALTLGLQRSWFVRAISLLLIRQILVIPRQGATQFLVEAFTASTVLGGVLILGMTVLFGYVIRRRSPDGPPHLNSRLAVMLHLRGSSGRTRHATERDE